MTKNVRITITGEQRELEENSVTIEAPGSYHFANGKHFIQYEEVREELGKKIGNTIKVSASEVTYTKKDDYNTRMYFELNQVTQMDYHTTYGVLALDIKTKTIDISESDDIIEVKLEYSLFESGLPVSENMLHIIVKAEDENAENTQNQAI